MGSLLVREGLYILVPLNSHRHGDSLAIVGSQQLRERALLPGNRDPFIDISDVQYCLLEVHVYGY